MKVSTPVLFGALALIALAGSYFKAGTPGFIGMTFALIAGGTSVAALAGMSRFLGRLMADKASPKIGTIIVVLGGFVKFPLLLFAWWATRPYGASAEGAFAAGLVLVYSALVGWAATRNPSDL